MFSGRSRLQHQFPMAEGFREDDDSLDFRIAPDFPAIGRSDGSKRCHIFLLSCGIVFPQSGDLELRSAGNDMQEGIGMDMGGTQQGQFMQGRRDLGDLHRGVGRGAGGLM